LVERAMSLWPNNGEADTEPAGRKEKTMTELAADAFPTVGPGDAIPNDYVVPYYLDDRKRRVSVARVGDLLIRIRA
jgi:hypothetical protein